MDRFIKELEVGEIHQRDRWQFELKSEFIPSADLRHNVFTQEFFLFIPNSLQVHPDTYDRKQFYQDLTNYIRYKTPEFTLKELCDKDNDKSPLTRLASMRNSSPTPEKIPYIEDELKLLGNVVRSSVRERARELVRMIKNKPDDKALLTEKTRGLCSDLTQLRDSYFEIQSDFLDKWNTITQQSHFLYIDEFICDNINYYLTGLLDFISQAEINQHGDIEEMVGKVLAREKRHREEVLAPQKITEEESVSNEYILYRSSLLNKFVLDALLLRTNRASVTSRFLNVVGSFAAGIAMLFFFVLFVKQKRIFLINSSPFIFITVLLYILKDRIKEGLKPVSYKLFAKWFSDYKTEIKSPDEKKKVGRMGEYFSFIKEKEVPNEISRIRNREFHVVLETFKRPEQVIYYKKKIQLYGKGSSQDIRRNALNIIFRFNIHEFLKKADNPTHKYVTVDPDTLKLFRVELPKVYHLNIIMKNTYYKRKRVKAIELKKFRLILDKNGIKRVEHLTG